MIFCFFGANANDIEFSVYNPSNWTEQNIFFNFYRTVSSTLDCPFYYKGTMTYYNPNNFIFNNFFQYFSASNIWWLYQYNLSWWSYISYWDCYNTENEDWDDLYPLQIAQYSSTYEDWPELIFWWNSWFNLSSVSWTNLTQLANIKYSYDDFDDWVFFRFMFNEYLWHSTSGEMLFNYASFVNRPYMTISYEDWILMYQDYADWLLWDEIFYSPWWVWVRGAFFQATI